MDYLFYGPYWLFCVVRAGMTASFGEAEYGSFAGFDGLFLGFFFALAWFFIVFGVMALIIEAAE